MNFTVTGSMQMEFQKIYKEAENYCYILEGYLGYDLTQKMKESIVFHICAAMIRNRTYLYPLNVLIVCPGSMATGKFVEAQIKNYYDFTIKGVVAHTTLAEWDFVRNKVDFIISTMSLPETQQPVVTVNALLSYNDLNNIQEIAFSLGKKVDNLLDKNKKNILHKLEKVLDQIETIEELDIFSKKIDDIVGSNKAETTHISLKDMLHISHITICEEEMGWEEGMFLSGAVLRKEGFFSENYFKKAVENVREWGPYIILTKGITLVHANKADGVYKDGLSLLIAKQGVLFEGMSEKVYLLFCFCTKGDSEYFELFKEIVQIGKDEVKMKQILSAATPLESYNYMKEDD